MLKFYFATVLIWAVIIRCSLEILAEKIKDNGWLDDAKPSGKSIASLFCIAAIPIIRLLMVVALFYLAIYKKDEVK